MAPDAPDDAPRDHIVAGGASPGSPDDAHRAAPRTHPLKDLLQGKPFKHPLHTMLVHLPIGLWLLSLLFDLASWLNPGPTPPDRATSPIRDTLAHDMAFLPRGAFYTMLAGVVTALLAIAPGLADYSDIRRDHPARKTATWHMWLNLWAVALYVVNLVLRYPALNEDQQSTPTLPLILSLLGMALVGVSGYLGGVLIYDDGVGVGRHRRTTPTPRTTLSPRPDAPPPDLSAEGYVAVADAADLPDGQSLRADVNGHALAIVNVAGQCHAFQDFCTHRYAPLSEGQLRPNGTIVCPWHRSCFDVRTGKVLDGPAKVDLKTYEVRVRDGKVWVKAGEAEVRRDA